ncbi:malate dehydrogenase [Moniliophthora roreri MCA 2997]|uniref:Malate dehydrogenase n=1 Tax=Moniliophthora roreri (strain MCA 2997) TaxID=1381753 RepID=V2XHY8_MONRO|nr:malate dehydrogenase [Moniliophthora roreri MCA 2997]
MHPLSLLSFAFAVSAVALPAFRPGFSLGPPAGFPGLPERGSLNCDVTGAIVDTAGSALTAPQKPVSFIALGVGTQNYTCSDAGTYAYGIGVDSEAILGEHYFVPNLSGTGISPKWDFTSRAFKGNADAFVVAARQSATPAPTGKTDDWLYLTQVQGSLANEGPPPASCTPGSAPITVKYTSLYWLTGGTAKTTYM